MSMIQTWIRAIEANAGENVLLNANPKRLGYIVENDTDTALLISLSESTPTAEKRSYSIASKTVHHVDRTPADQLYKGTIRFALANSTGSGRIFITEILKRD